MHRREMGKRQQAYEMKRKKKVTSATRVPIKIYESPKQCYRVVAEFFPFKRLILT